MTSRFPCLVLQEKLLPAADADDANSRPFDERERSLLEGNLHDTLL
jgi:hypothetical protein